MTIDYCSGLSALLRVSASGGMTSEISLFSVSSVADSHLLSFDWAEETSRWLLFSETNVELGGTMVSISGILNYDEYGTIEDGGAGALGARGASAGGGQGGGGAGDCGRGG